MISDDLWARAQSHLKDHPEDEASVTLMMRLVGVLPIEGPRQLAQMAAGRALPDEEWTLIAPRWERPWVALYGP